MTLWDPERAPAVAPEDQIVVVHRFLERVRAWALERELPKRLGRLQRHPDASEAARLHAWVSTLAHTEHALRELEDGTLDHWFVDQDPPVDTSS